MSQADATSAFSSVRPPEVRAADVTSAGYGGRNSCGQRVELLTVAQTKLPQRGADEHMPVPALQSPTATVLPSAVACIARAVPLPMPLAAPDSITTDGVTASPALTKPPRFSQLHPPPLAAALDAAGGQRIGCTPLDTPLPAEVVPAAPTPAVVAGMAQQRVAAGSPRPPRPLNCFMLFGRHRRQQFKAARAEAEARLSAGAVLPTELRDQAEQSRIIGAEWFALPAAEKAKWRQLAEVEKREHALRHPGYKYKPGPPKTSKAARRRKAAVCRGAAAESRVGTSAAGRTGRNSPAQAGKSPRTVRRRATAFDTGQQLNRFQPRQCQSYLCPMPGLGDSGYGDLWSQQEQRFYCRPPCQHSYNTRDMHISDVQAHQYLFGRRCSCSSMPALHCGRAEPCQGDVAVLPDEALVVDPELELLPLQLPELHTSSPKQQRSRAQSVQPQNDGRASPRDELMRLLLTEWNLVEPCSNSPNPHLNGEHGYSKLQQPPRGQ